MSLSKGYSSFVAAIDTSLVLGILSSCLSKTMAVFAISNMVPPWRHFVLAEHCRFVGSKDRDFFSLFSYGQPPRGWRIYSGGLFNIVWYVWLTMRLGSPC